MKKVFFFNSFIENFMTIANESTYYLKKECENSYESFVCLICFSCFKFGLRDFILTCSLFSLIRQNIFLVLRDSHGLVQVLIPQDEVLLPKASSMLWLE